ARGIARGNRCDRMQRVLFAGQAMRITKTPKPVHGFIKEILGLSGTWMIQQAETGEIVIMPITHLAICKDCKANVGANGEWCMLRNSVWQKVWPGTTQKSIHAKMPMKHNLCIGCIERRLGRRLTWRDFDLRSPHNDIRTKRAGGVSRRLRNRLRKP